MTSFLGDLLNSIAERSRFLLDRNDPRGSGAHPVRLAEQLLDQSGEASELAIADQLFDAYDTLSDDDRAGFFSQLAQNFGPDLSAVDQAIAHYRGNPTAGEAARLHQVAEPRRQELIRKLNRTTRGTERLVQMRADLLPHVQAQSELRDVDNDFGHLLGSWFNRGFLVLEPITWNTPANILEKIIAYEAVHEIRSWNDLRRRIEPADRRCYAFFHPALNAEPLIFVEVALVKGMADAIAPILATEREQISADEADTAIFYSISNCQKGLAGISFGNFLIKQVARELLLELPHLKRFATLSPVPTFRRWAEREVLDDLETARASGMQSADLAQDLARLSDDDWYQDEALATRLRGPLTGLAARYFLDAKHRSGHPYDPVQRFHLGNGARLDRINWLGDLSDRGRTQAFGLMVNYVYDLDKIEENHQAYAERHMVVASNAVKQLGRQKSVAALMDSEPAPAKV
ncbi:MAG: malonyl-CoA decarboxylase [Pseudomonadota bacterium]